MNAMVSLDTLPAPLRELVSALMLQQAKPECTTTLTTIVDTYMAHAQVAMRTRKNNILSLLMVLRRAKGSELKAEDVLLREIDAGLITTFQNEAVERYCRAADKDDAAQRIARERALRSTRSTLTQARSVFSKDMVRLYREKGIDVPEGVLRFTAAPLRGQSTSTDYHGPPDDVAARTMDRIELMRADVPVYLGYWLAIGAALRKSEIHYCKWESIRDAEEGAGMIAGGIGKDNREITQPIMARAYQSILPYRKAGGWVITERSGLWAKRLSFWLRSQGWTGQKTIHGLRAYTGSLVFAKLGAVHAARFLRHKDCQITQRHYVRFHMGVDPAAMNLL
jgi:integrase